MSEQQTKSQHTFALARDLLDDIELGRLSAEALLLKASRLARLVGTKEEQQWLELELVGYNSRDPVSLRYLSKTGRWINREEKKALWGPLAQQSAAIEASKLSLQSLSTQGIGGEGTVGAVRIITQRAMTISDELKKLEGIRSRVLGLLHTFVSKIYYEKLFSGAAETIFGRYQSSVDGALASVAGDAISKLPNVYGRLTEGDPEAISQAMNTCRRMIKTFADAVFPPSEEPYFIGDQEMQVGPDQYLNRLNAFVASQTESGTRRKRLRQSLANLNDGICAGVHGDIALEEAQALVLGTYLLLGELAQLGGLTVVPASA